MELTQTLRNTNMRIKIYELFNSPPLEGWPLYGGRGGVKQLNIRLRELRTLRNTNMRAKIYELRFT